MKELAKEAIQIFGLGLLIAAGVRIGEWVIPAPETRLVVCFANELDQVEICKPASELLKKKGGAA